MTKLNINDKNFSIELNTSTDNQLYNMLLHWKSELDNFKLKDIEDNNDNDTWYQLPVLPQFVFKNLYIINIPLFQTDNVNDISITIKYDNYKKL
jgi:hypothetical protein